MQKPRFLDKKREEKLLSKKQKLKKKSNNEANKNEYLKNKKEICVCEKKDVPLQGDNKSGWLMRITNQIKSEPSAFEELRKQYKLR